MTENCLNGTIACNSELEEIFANQFIVDEGLTDVSELYTVNSLMKCVSLDEISKHIISIMIQLQDTLVW